MRLLICSLLALSAIATGAWFASAKTLEAGGGGGCHEPLSDGAVTQISIFENCFGPTVARVQPGSTITWNNLDGAQHNVYAPGQDWSKAEPLMKGASASATFTAAGIYPYVCSFHPGMVGVIVVGEGISATAQPYEGKPPMNIAPAEQRSPNVSVPVAAMNLPRSPDGDGGATLAFAGLGAVASALGVAAVGASRCAAPLSPSRL